MIKKFNENWELDSDESFENINVHHNDDWNDVYKRAKNLAIMKNKKVKYVFQNITHIVTGKTDKNKLLSEFYKNKGKDNVTIEADIEPNMDTVAIYAKNHSISYEEALDELSKKVKPVNFSKGTEVIGLPSGQVIYMSVQSIRYFKSRNLISFKNTWKKPTIGGGLIPIDINHYTFEDKHLNDILDKMNIIDFNDN